MTKVTSVRLSDELAERLDQLSDALDRPKGWVIEQAVARYVDEEAWQVAAIAEEYAAYQAEERSGQITGRPHDEVMADFEARIKARLRLTE